MSQMDLYYWPIKARSYAAMAVAQAGGLNIRQVVPDMAALKPELPFGQVPYLVDGDVKLAHSNAILRYVSKKAGLEGDNDKAYAISQMFIEECTDILEALIKAHYSPVDKVKAYTDFFAAGGPLHKQLTYLEALHPGDGPYFNNQTDKRVAGAYVIASTLDILIGTEATILANYPKLQLFYTTMISTKAFDGIRDYTTYFTK